jgi:hypothetical protein
VRSLGDWDDIRATKFFQRCAKIGATHQDIVFVWLIPLLTWILPLLHLWRRREPQLHELQGWAYIRVTQVAIQPERGYGGAVAGGSQGPVVKSWRRASILAMPHLAVVDR